MNIEQLADLLNKLITVHMRSNWREDKSRWYAVLEGAEVKDRALLRSAFGDGDCPNNAVRALAKELAGATIVFNATGPNRTEFTAPKDLV